MHPQTAKLISKVNSKLDKAPLIYFSRDVERGIGLENLLKNYYFACVEDSYLVHEINKKKERVFSLNKNKIKVSLNSTQEVINNEKTQRWIKKITKGGDFYAQLFQFNQSAINKIHDLGGQAINNHTNLNRKFEDKISQFRILRANNIPVPNGEVILLNNQSLKELLSEINIRINNQKNKPLFVVQLSRAHTGSGTFFIKNNEEWSLFLEKNRGNEIKISEYIEGESYTINGCVTQKGIFVAGLQYQITGVRELTAGEGSTVGNDFSYANKLRVSLKREIFEVTKSIGEIMQKDGYRGLFGLDLVVKNNEIFVIEINARQTANVSLQTKLEILQNKIPLSLINIAEWLGIELPFETFDEINHLEGSQLFLRSKEVNFIIAENVKSGIYRLQSDNAVRLAKDEDVILLDEEGDKPLIWQKDGYSVEDIKEGGFILLVQKQWNRRDLHDEIARMQFKHQIMLDQHSKGIVSPWAIEAMNAIKERVM